MAKKTLWQRIKNFFSGGNSDSAKARSNRLIRRKNTGGTRTSTNRVAIYRSLRGQSNSGNSGNGGNSGNKEEKQSSYKSMADAIKESSKKQTPDPKEAIRKKAQSDARELLEKRKETRKSAYEETQDIIKKHLDDAKKKQKAYHEATGHRYDVAEKGISKEERQKRLTNIQATPVGLMRFGNDDEALDVAKVRMKYDKVGASAERGIANAVTMNAVDLLAKNSRGERKEAEEYYQKNKSKAAETVGGLAGGLALYGGTAGAFEGLGAKAVGKAATTKVGKKLGAEALKRTMAGEGAKAAITRSLVGDAIQDSTIGLADTIMGVAARDDLKTKGDYAKAIAKGQAANYAMGLAGNAVAHGLPVAGRAVGKAWSNFADESRKLRVVPKGVDELLSERKRIMDDIFSKNERSDPAAIDRIKEIDAELERLGGATPKKTTKGKVKKAKNTKNTKTEEPKITDETVKKPADAAEPEAKITEDNVKKEAPRKATKNEKLRDELRAERASLQERYEAAKAAGEDTTEILDDMQEIDLMVKDLDRKIAKAQKSAKKKAPAARTVEETVEAAEAPRAAGETAEAPRTDLASSGETARADENARAGERTEFRRSNEETAREQARNRRTTNNRESATQESFDRDFADFGQKIRENHTKAEELRRKIRSAASEEEREALRSQLNALKDEIKSAYRRASLRYHPDRGGSDEWMRRFNEAYDDYRRGSYSSPGFSDATSSTRPRPEAGNGGNGNTPPPRRNRAANGESGFNRPKGKARQRSNTSYVYRGEDTVYKRKEAPTLKQKGEKVVADARMKFSDSHAPFEDDARKFAKSNPEEMQKRYGAIDAHRRSNAVATQSIHNGQVNYLGDKFENGKSLKDIFKGLDEESERAFDYYLMLKHAPDRFLEGKPIWDTRTLIDGRRLGDPEYLARIKKNRKIAEDLEQRIRYTKDDGIRDALQKELDDLTEEMARDTEETMARLREVWDAEAERVIREHPEANFEARAKDVYQYTRNELQNLVDAGIVSKETAAQWSQQHPFYVPTHRDGYAGLTGSVHGSSVSAKGVQAATGSDLDIRSVRDQLEEATRQNWEDITLNDMLKSSFGDRIREKPSGLLEGDFEQAIENNISISKSKDGRKFFAEIFVNGKKHRVEIDKKYVDGLQDWNKHGKIGHDVFDVPNEALSKVAKVFKGLITEYNPIFMLKNPMRDFPEAYINSRQSKEFRQSMVAALKDLASGGPYSTALKNSGISQSSFFDLDKAILKDGESRKGLGKVIGAIGDKLEAGNQFMEMWPRLTEYMATFKKAGVDIKDADKALRNMAAANAADVTVNFGRSGSIGKALNKGYIPFFNPSIQGWSKFARNLTEQPGAKAYLEFFAKAGALGVGLTVANNYLLKDNPNYQIISARDKANNIIIPWPLTEARTTDRFIRIPQSRFASVYSLPAVNMFNENKMGFADMIKVANDQVAPVNPIENHLGAALLDTKRNKTWYGTPIVSGALEDLPKPEQYDANTSDIGRLLGKATENLPEPLQISPKKADYFIDAETGVIGDFLLPLTTPSRQGGGKGLQKYGPAAVGTLTRPFTIDAATQNDLSSRFYEQLQKANTNSKSARSGEAEKNEYKRMSAYSTAASSITAAIKHLQGSDSTTKQKDIHELQIIRNQLMQDAIDGKDAPLSTNTMNAVQKYVGTTYAINNFGTATDQTAMKVYGAAKYGALSEKEMQKRIDADKNFYNGIRNISSLEDKMAKAGIKSNTTLSKAVALASVNADDELFGAYRATKQSRTETANKMDRARNYFRDGGSEDEFVQLEKARKTLGKLSEYDESAAQDENYRKLQRGEITAAEYHSKEDEIAYNANLSYVGLATSLAQANAPERGYRLYDIKDKNIQKGINLAAMGFTARDYRKMAKEVDANGNGYPSKQEIIDYVSRSDVADKATLYDALYYYKGSYNPFGSVTNYSRAQAAEAGRKNGVTAISNESGEFKISSADSSGSGYSGGFRRGYRYKGRSGGKSKVPTINAKSMAAATKSVKGTSVKLTPPTPKTKVAAPKFKKYEV